LKRHNRADMYKMVPEKGEKKDHDGKDGM
jgi:hypothetical protein